MTANFTKPRLVTLDAIKVLAAISIVWLHTVSSLQLGFTSVLGRFAVPFFTATAVFIVFSQVLSDPSIHFRQYVTSRLKRVYLPFLLWSVFYLAIRYLNCLVSGSCHGVGLELNFIWTGPTHHLWFLPFVFAVSLPSFLLAKLISIYPNTKIFVAVSTLILGVAVLNYANYDWANQFGYTAMLSYEVVPAALWGACMAITNNLFCLSVGKKASILSFFGLSGFVLILIVLLTTGRSLAFENLGGISLLLIAITYNYNRGRSSVSALSKISTFGKYSYGLYLVHILYVEGLQDVASIFRFSETPGLDVSVFFLSLVLSFQTILVLRKAPFHKWVGV